MDGRTDPTVRELGRGYKEWDTKVLQEFTSSGLRCSIIRTQLGSLCGYVETPKAIPGDCDGESFAVHGGVTWCSSHRPDKESGSGWCYGFDCAHLGDHIPGMRKLEFAPEETYKDEAYVTKELEHLAKQLREALGPKKVRGARRRRNETRDTEQEA